MNLDRAMQYFKMTAAVFSTISTIEKTSQYGGRAYEYITPYVSAAVETVSSDASSFFPTLIKSKVASSVIGMALGSYAISKIPVLKGDLGSAVMFTGITAASMAALGPSILLPCTVAYVAGRCVTYVHGPMPSSAVPGTVESIMLSGTVVSSVAEFGPLALIPHWTYMCGRLNMRN